MNRSLFSLLGAAVSLGALGWGLSILQAPTSIWVGTGLIIAYLLRTGQRGILVASIWITLLVSLTVALDLFPNFWPEKMAYRYWAMAVILFWVTAIAAAWLWGLSLSQGPRSPRAVRTSDSILQLMAPEVRDSLSDAQRREVERLVDLALPKPNPKLVDLRVDVDLLLDRFYIVLLVGQDRRQERRHYTVSRLTRVGNWLTAIVLLIGINLAMSITVLMLAYLLKSALGIDLLPGHFRGFGR